MKCASGGRVARIPVDAQRVSCTAHTDPGVSGASVAKRLEAKRARAGGRALCAPADDAVLAMRHGGGGTCVPPACICAFCKANAG